MTRTIGTLVAAAAALALSASAYAQNNTLATPSVTSPVPATSGYGTNGVTASDSGAAASTMNANMANGAGNSAYTPPPNANNTLATPSVHSPVGQ